MYSSMCIYYKAKQVSWSHEAKWMHFKMAVISEDFDYGMKYFSQYDI